MVNSVDIMISSQQNLSIFYSLSIDIEVLFYSASCSLFLTVKNCTEVIRDVCFQNAINMSMGNFLVLCKT